MPSGTMTAQSAIPAKASGNSHSRRYAAIQSKIGNNLRAAPAKSAEKFDMVRPIGHEPTSGDGEWSSVVGPHFTIPSLSGIRVEQTPLSINRFRGQISTNLNSKPRFVKKSAVTKPLLNLRVNTRDLSKPANV